MAQILLPDSDIATGAWSSTPLWSRVDDDSTVNASGDGTTITSDNNTAPDNADLGLATGTDPSSSSSHILRARWNKDSSGGHAINAVLELWQGTPGTGTLVATLSVTGIGNTETESTHTLSAAEADSITDYSALNLRVSRQGETGGNPNGRRSLVVDLVEFEIPDAGADPVAVQLVPASLTSSAQPLAPSLGAATAEVVPASVALSAQPLEPQISSSGSGEITMVGTPQAGGAGNGGDVTLAFDVAPQTDDVVIVLQHQGDSVGSGPAGYTEITRPDSGINGASMWYKVMGATPDTDVLVPGSGSAQDATSAASYVLRGVDTSNVLDATTVEVGPNTTNDPDPGAITTATDNAWAIVAVGENGTDSDLGDVPTGYSDLVEQATVDTNRANIAMARKEVATAGSEDPGAFTGWSTSEWYSFTVAIRPASSGGVAIELASASMSIQPQALGLSLGATTIELAAASSSLTPQALGVSVNPLSVELVPASASLTSQAFDLSLGVLSVELATAAPTLSAQALSPQVSGSPVSVELAPATFAVNAQPLGLSLGATSVALVPAGQSLDPQALAPSVGVSVVLVPAAASATPQPLGVVTQPLSVALAPADLVLAAQALGVSVSGEENSFDAVRVVQVNQQGIW